MSENWRSPKTIKLTTARSRAVISTCRRPPALLAVAVVCDRCSSSTSLNKEPNVKSFPAIFSSSLCWGLALAVISLAGPHAQGEEAPSRPNLLFIIADDCTYRDVACYGGQAATPNIDRLASEGMRFTQSFQAAPMCSPTRHCIYTGMYPVRTGAYPNHTFAKAGTRSVVHYLQPLGYHVALSGKSHVAPQKVFPFEYSGAGKNNKTPDWSTIETLFAETSESETPFCLFVCSTEPHTPWNKGDVSRYPPESLNLPPYFVDTPETRENFSRYLAEVTYFDGEVGRCLALLEKYHLDDSTLVLVTTEQGSSFPFGKWTCYDTGLQNGLIARWPGKVEPGTVSDALVEYVDVLPTFIDAAGGTAPAQLEGKSYLPVLTGEATEHKAVVFGLQTTRGITQGADYYGIRMARNDRFKYIRNLTPEAAFENNTVFSDMFLSWRAKAKTDEEAAELVDRYQHRPAEELYDIVADPYELNNLADDPQHAEVVSQLRCELDRWMEDQGDKGHATELAAFEHQVGGKNRKKKKK